MGHFFNRYILRNGVWANPRDSVPQEPFSPTPWLPFDLDTTDTAFANSTKKVWAHYFPGFPISPSSTSDYWATKWYPPGAVEGTTDHTVYGGFVRSRKPRDLDVASGFNVRHKLMECQQAKAAGIDGFIINMLSITAGNAQRQRAEDLIAAANQLNDPKFKIILAPDSNTSATASASTLATYLDSVLGNSCIYVHNDRPLLMSFKPENAPNHTSVGRAFWDDLFAAMSTDVYFWPFYEQLWTDPLQAPAYNSLPNIVGHSQFARTDPITCESTGNAARGAVAYCQANFPGKMWMHYACNQNIRPYSSDWWEPRGFDCAIASLRAAIDTGADAIQVVTWDDFSESTNWCVTNESGHAWLDILSYFIWWFKTGSAPTIARDAIYLAARTQLLTGMTFSGPQSEFMNDTFGYAEGNCRGSTPPENKIHALAFLTDDATVRIYIDGVLKTQTTASAGYSILKVNAEVGTPSATIVRNGQTIATVTAQYPISTNAVSQDYTYRVTGSLSGEGRVA